MKDRLLTTGEITLAQSVYKDSVDYQKVKIHEHGKYFFQPNNSGMTPDGEVYAKGNAYVADYSVEPGGLQGFFIHEMAHVWQ